MDEQQRRRLERERVLLLRRLASIGDFARGSVVLMKRKCTYPGCRRCASGQRHPTWVLTVSRNGKTKTVYLGKKRLAQAQRLVRNYRTLTEMIEQIADVNLQLLREGSAGSTEEEGGNERRKARGTKT